MGRLTYCAVQSSEQSCCHYRELSFQKAAKPKMIKLIAEKQMLGQLRIAKESRKEMKDVKDRKENWGKCLLTYTSHWIKTHIKIQQIG